MAFIGSLPVEVFIKSAPAIIHTADARATLRKVPSSPVAKIVFIWAEPQAFLKSLTSSYKAFQFCVRTWRRDITMSISLAPAETLYSISAMRRGSGDSPAGKPVDTAATGIPVPLSFDTAVSIISW